MFAQLYIFRGGFTRHAAQLIVPSTMRDLIYLVDKSLVRRTSNGRYSIHPLVAQFIADQAKDKDELAERHCRYYLEWVVEHAAELNDYHARGVLEQFRIDLENIRAAWQYAVAHQLLELGRRAVGALGEFYDYSGLLQPALDIFAAALSHVQDAAWRGALYVECAYFYVRVAQFDRAAHAVAQARVLNQALGDAVLQARIEYTNGLVLVRRGDYALAPECLERAQRLAEKALRHDIVAKALLARALVYRMQGNASATIQVAENALDLSRQIGNRRLEGRALSDLGYYLLMSSKQDRAGVLLARALEIRQSMGDPWGEAATAGNLVALYAGQARYQAALDLQERVLALCQEVGDRSSYCLALGNLGVLWLDIGDVGRGEQLANKTFALATELNLRWGELSALICMSNAQFERGTWESAARVAQQALASAEKSQALPEQALAGLILSQALSAQDQFQVALEVCRKANACARQVDDPVLECELAVEQVYLVWQCGDLELARQQVEGVLERLRQVTPSNQLAWFRMCWQLYQVLRACGDARADELLLKTQRILETQAAQITEPTLREIFLNNPAHRVILKATDR